MKKIISHVYIFILLLLGVSQNVSAQSNNQAGAIKRIAILKFAPLVLVEPEGGFQAGVEVPIAPNFSGQFEFAYLPFYYGNEGGGFFKTLPGFNTTAYKAELRYFITDRNFKTQGSEEYFGKDLQGFYVAGQGQVKIANTADSALVFDSSGTSVILTAFNVQSTIYKANLKIGYQVITDNGFVIDIYTGAGYRHKTVKTEPPAFRETLVDNFNLLPINFALGIKVGWAF